MFLKAKWIALSLVVFPLVAVAADDIRCPPSDDRANATCIVVPEKDGTFLLEFRAEADGNGHGTPTISTKIVIDDAVCSNLRTVAWKDGHGGATAICTKRLKADQGYTVTAVSNNTNAVSSSAVLTATRSGKK